MKFVPEAAKWYKLYTIHGLAVISTLSAILIGLPNAMKTHPIYGDITVQSLILFLTILASALTGFLRLIKQFYPELDQDDPTDSPPNP